MVRLFTSSLLAALAVVSMTLMLPMSVAHADMIPSAPASSGTDPVAGEQVVADQMALAGLSQDEIQARLSQLTPTDVETLAANPRQVNMAGNAWAIIAVAVGIVALVSILVLDSIKAKEDEQYRTY